MTYILAALFTLPTYLLLNGFLAYPVHERLLEGRYMGEKPSPGRFWAVSAATPLILAKETFDLAADRILPWRQTK